MASFTSKVYATFPALSEEGRKPLVKEGVWFGKCRSDNIPSATECEQFEKALKKAIITTLNQKEKNNFIKLLTDYYPEKTLLQVAESVFNKEHRLDFFPCKTCTRIAFQEERTKLKLLMYFKMY